MYISFVRSPTPFFMANGKTHSPDNHDHDEPRITEHRFCAGCGAKIHKEAHACPKCGLPTHKPAEKNQTTAGLLALFLGGIGIHKFYLGQSGLGILYLLFCWTFIPGIIAFIEAIIYFTASPEKWRRISQPARA